MGRVDDAMRRAAETAGGAGLEPAATARPAMPEEADEPRADFPSELSAERTRLRPVSSPANVPKMDDRPGSGKQQAESMIPDLASRMDASLQHKVVVDRDMDPASREQYRRLAAGLHATQAAAGLKVVMMVSAVASEGKSLTSSNLALTFSESYNRQVLLIDGDMRRPSLHTIFGLPVSPGLGEGLGSTEEGKVSLHRLSPRLSLLTAGQPTSDPMGALVSPRMAKLISEARGAFDWVFVDTPPIGLLPDASLLGQMVDGAILVVRAESTPYDVVQRAVAALGKDRLLGVVLNRAQAVHGGAYKYDAYYGTANAPRNVK